MNKWRGRPIGFKRALQTIGPKLVSNVYNGLKRDRGSGREGRGIWSS